MGRNGIDIERMEMAIKVVDSHPPESRFDIKDHKDTPEGEQCPPSRCVCNATEGPLSRTSGGLQPCQYQL